MEEILIKREIFPFVIKMHISVLFFKYFPHIYFLSRQAYPNIRSLLLTPLCSSNIGTSRHQLRMFRQQLH